MNQDQAWPQWSDFAPGGGFHELTLRLRNSLLWGGLFMILTVAGKEARPPYEPLHLLGAAALIGSIPALIAWSFPPSPRRLGHAPQARIEWAGKTPATRQPQNLLTPRQERRDLWALLLVVVLTAVTGVATNLSLMLLFSPLIVFRLCSRLWTEVDLVGGRVYYHRTFMGMQITRAGASLEQAVGLVSGVRLENPGEEPVFAVCAVLPHQEPLPLDSMSLTREQSQALGRRLCLQLNLPEFEPDSSPSQATGRARWKPIQFRKNPEVSCHRLPPVAETP